MLTVHKKGMAVVGIFSHEIVETKVAQVMDFSGVINIHYNARWRKSNFGQELCMFC